MTVRGIRDFPNTIAAFAFLVIMGCVPPPPPQQTRPPLPGPELTLHVYAAACRLPGTDVSGATVTAIAKDGREIQLGNTFGADIRIKKSRLREINARYVIVCSRPIFQCVALDVDENQLYECDEYYVDLPAVLLR